jgi:hypothetical protein
MGAKLLMWSKTLRGTATGHRTFREKYKSIIPAASEQTVLLRMLAEGPMVE